MARDRDAERRWLYAACVAGAYVVVVTTLFMLRLGADFSVPIVVAVAVPPLVYAALSLLLLREASLARRLAWIGGACMAHLVLAALASVEVMWAGGLPLMAALAQVFRRFAPAPALTLLATPIVLWLLAPSPARPAARPDAPPLRRSSASSSPRARSVQRAAPRLVLGDRTGTPAEPAAPPVALLSRSAARAREASRRIPAVNDLPPSSIAVPRSAAAPSQRPPTAAVAPPALLPTLEIPAPRARVEPSTPVAPSAPMDSPPVPPPPPAEPVAPVWPPSPQVDRFVSSLVDGGAFHASVVSVDGVPCVQLVEPGLDRAAVGRWAAAVMRSGEGGEITTVRATRAVLVLAVGAPSFFVATRRPGIPAGYLEVRAARAIDGPSTAAVTATQPRRRLEALAVEDRIAGAGRLLASFGPVEPTAFTDRGTPVYVFSRRGCDAASLGARALGLSEALGEGGKLGRLVSITIRRGVECTLVRPLAAGTAVLVATGPVTRPGRAHRDAERAATMLESR